MQRMERCVHPFYFQCQSYIGVAYVSEQVEHGSATKHGLWGSVHFLNQLCRRPWTLLLSYCSLYLSLHFAVVHWHFSDNSVIRIQTSSGMALS